MIYITLGNLQWNVDKGFSFVVINTIVISGFHSAVLSHKHAISLHITTHPDDQNNTNKDQPCFIYMAVFIQPFCSSITTAMRDKNGILWQKNIPNPGRVCGS